MLFDKRVFADTRFLYRGSENSNDAGSAYAACRQGHSFHSNNIFTMSQYCNQCKLLAKSVTKGINECGKDYEIKDAFKEHLKIHCRQLELITFTGAISDDLLNTIK